MSSVDRRHYGWQLLVEYLADVEGMPFDRLVSDRVTEAACRGRLLAWYKGLSAASSTRPRQEDRPYTRAASLLEEVVTPKLAPPLAVAALGVLLAEPLHAPPAGSPAPGFTRARRCRGWRRATAFGVFVLGATACGGQGGSPSPCVDPPASIPAVACDGGRCPAITVAGDGPAGNPGTFRGYADPTIAHDPLAPQRVWLAYSWPHLVPGRAPGGAGVLMAAVATHLARSDDGGRSFSYAGELWPAIPTRDPEGSGASGLSSSETPSLAAIVSGGATTWFGVHLRYFLEPETGYHPKYATSWTVRVGAAASPEALASAPEAVLGVSGTSPVYRPDARLDQLAGVPLPRCAMLNNPTLFAQDGTLYLIVECLAFVGTTLDFGQSTTRVFATVPAGPPSTWTWRHAGVLADHSLARELGDDTVQQPDVSLAADGRPIAIVTPAHADASVEVGTVGDGCVALELLSIDPPALARDCSGRVVVRARVEGSPVGACTHDPRAAGGIVATKQTAGGGNWMIHTTGLRP